MALDPKTYAPFTSRITAATPDYPLGSSKVETAPAAGDGTPYEIGRANDVFGFQQALLEQAELVASGTADTALLSQYLEAIVRLGSLGNFFADTGAADAYVLGVSGNLQNPSAYFDGMQISFLTANANTGASTVAVGGLAAKDVRFIGGGVLPANAIRTDKANTARFDFANDYFELETPIIEQDIGVIHKDMTDHAHTGDTAITALATFSMPANTIGPTGGIKITTVYQIDGVTNTPTSAGVNFGSALVSNKTLAIGAARTIVNEVTIFNVNALTQRTKNFASTTPDGSATGYLDTTEDTTAIVDIEASIQLGDSSDTITLKMFTVERIDA